MQNHSATVKNEKSMHKLQTQRRRFLSWYRPRWITSLPLLSPQYTGKRIRLGNAKRGVLDLREICEKKTEKQTFKN